MNSHDSVAELVEAAAGLQFAGHQHRRLVRAVDHAAHDARCRDLDAYAELLRCDPDAMHRLVDALTVGETYFFRDEAQGRLLQSVLTTTALARPSGPIEVWSAGCATGEEAYSIAMLAAEAGLGSRVRILGTDVSPTAIGMAEAGQYGRRSLRATSEARRHRWFHDAGGGQKLVASEVRAAVRFRHANLLAGPPGDFDVIVCRNVLIYFSPAAVQRAAVVFHDALRPGAWLVTGASDPQLHAPGLVRERTPFGLVFRRGDGATAGPAATTAPTRRRAPLRARPPHVEAAPTIAVAAGRPAPAGHVPTLEDIRRLADSGRRDEAAGLVRAALRDQPFDAELRYLDAVLHLDAGRLDEAGDAARAALYLDADLAPAHLVVAHVAQARGDAVAAARSYAAAERALSALAPDAPVHGADEPQAGHLAATAARLAGKAAARAR